MQQTSPKPMFVDPERIAAMLLYTHNDSAEQYAQSRVIEARLRGQPDAVQQWRKVILLLGLLRGSPK
ncbi:MAG: hypothetical protein NVSMB18_28340 [Acetobacteraceae bacterium]